ncbi:hypothetical protein J14TS2_11250 [Bacillus sp. J14TS2]|nr:hypothetical protein J14TS2_11250 [Bacillus sp. J14TS2]
MIAFIYLELIGNKTPTSRIRGKNKNCKWGTTASKSPIGSGLLDAGHKGVATYKMY